jgi:predicted O-linked N-acetylglucosamine transferase (SPINDLY family)
MNEAINLAMKYRSENKTIQAIKHLESYGEPVVLNIIGVFYAELKMYTEASKYMLMAINDPRSTPDLLGSVFHNLGTITNDNYKAVYYLEMSEKLLGPPGPLAGHGIKMASLQAKLLKLNYITTDNDLIYNESIKINKYFSVPQGAPERGRTALLAPKDPTGPINIGYLSSDFRNHAVTKFIYGIIENHDRSRFKVHCYYNSNVIERTTNLYKNIPGITFRHIFDLSDIHACDLIKSDNIHVLIDLNGHTEGSRMALLQLKPAPIQIEYLGYPGTTGLYQMTHRLTDTYTEDPRQKFVEKLLYLDFFLNYRPNDLGPNIWSNYDPVIIPRPLRPLAGQEGLVYGSFNKSSKNSVPYISALLEIARLRPDSKILFKLGPDEVHLVSDYQKLFGSQAIFETRSPEQLENIDYYRLFNTIDVLLDTWPYTGTTTTCDSLYMGTPVLTLRGPVHCHNVSSDIIMHTCGTDTTEGAPLGQSSPERAPLRDYICNDIPEYIRKAVAHTGLSDKKKIRSMFMKSMDTQKFMKNYETVLSDIVHNPI